MKTINQFYSRTSRPIKVLQFGAGNFLRAFVDYMIDVANEKGVFNGGIVIVKSLSYGSIAAFKEQDNLYTVSLRGKENGNAVTKNRVITSIEKVIDCNTEYEDFLSLAQLDTLEFVISNTTEAGIVLDESDSFNAAPPRSYPGKLTRFLFERYKIFNGDLNKGLIILPAELIENNGGKLKSYVLKLSEIWGLESKFIAWVQSACTFCSTLVDRISTGFPKDDVAPYYEELGYIDKLLDIAEPFGLWVIESEMDISARFPLNKADMPVIFTKNQTPYRERKVRILNGAHTATVLAAFLIGKDTVLECMETPLIRKFMDTIVLEEIVPTVNLPVAEATAFAEAVFERFENPFVKHSILSISLNSVSKWRARLLPPLHDSFNATGKIPPLLSFSFAALLAFYTISQTDFHGKRTVGKNKSYEVHDLCAVMTFFSEKSSLGAEAYVNAIASNTEFWGEDLTKIPQFCEVATTYLTSIREKGITAAMEDILSCNQSY